MEPSGHANRPRFLTASVDCKYLMAAASAFARGTVSGGSSSMASSWSSSSDSYAGKSSSSSSSSGLSGALGVACLSSL